MMTLIFRLILRKPVQTKVCSPKNWSANLGLCFLITLFSSTPFANETVHLQLRSHHQFQFAGYYAAFEKGYYKKAGLDVVIHEGNTEGSAITEVQKNHAQYGVDNSEVLHERLNGVKLIALAAIFQHSPSILVTQEDILLVNDLVGKKIMLAKNDGDDDILIMIKNASINKTQFDAQF
jgi:ABC-type nitrate/sulfonate/bicarbonate transport system substrate-binding protein